MKYIAGLRVHFFALVKSLFLWRMTVASELFGGVRISGRAVDKREAEVPRRRAVSVCFH